MLDGVLCLCVDRLARAYAYKVLILEELQSFGVTVHFLEGPEPSDDPQATLLIQMQGVIAEYEKAKIAERYRRGKLYRARAGEIPFWKCSYGHRRVVDPDSGRSRIEIYEPEAEIVRSIFHAYVERGLSVRKIALELRDRTIPSPSGKPQWGTSSLDRLLRNEAYIGTVYYNRYERTQGGTRGRMTRQRERPREEWITIPVPAIIDSDTFEHVNHITHENWRLSPRTTGPDSYLFGQVRQALLDPQQLLAGERAVLAGTPDENELITGQLKRLSAAIDAKQSERARLLDAYQAGLLDLGELTRRTSALTARHHQLVHERDTLTARSAELSTGNPTDDDPPGSPTSGPDHPQPGPAGPRPLSSDARPRSVPALRVGRPLARAADARRPRQRRRGAHRGDRAHHRLRASAPHHDDRYLKRFFPINRLPSRASTTRGRATRPRSLSEPADSGLSGALCARAEAHTIRLALIYALIDGAQSITPKPPTLSARALGLRRRQRHMGTRTRKRRPPRRADPNRRQTRRAVARPTLTPSALNPAGLRLCAIPEGKIAFRLPPRSAA